MSAAAHRCGSVALVGRPNVGKSTLLNALIGYRLSITSKRAQTTRHRILGIRTRPEGQILYVDTPGLHRREPRALNRQMNRVARGMAAEADVVVLVVEAGRWTDEDSALLAELRRASRRLLVVANKVDRVRDKRRLLPWLEQLAEQHGLEGVFLVSALRREALEALERALLAELPEGEAIYGEDEITDRPERFLVAETVREQLLRQLGDEVPHAAAVEIERFERSEGMLRVAAVIWVERPGQKAIVIGEGGQQLRRIGERARGVIERQFGERVFLKLWVKERSGWADDAQALRQLGIGD